MHSDTLALAENRSQENFEITGETAHEQNQNALHDLWQVVPVGQCERSNLPRMRAEGQKREIGREGSSANCAKAIWAGLARHREPWPSCNHTTKTKTRDERNQPLVRCRQRCKSERAGAAPTAAQAAVLPCTTRAIRWTGHKGTRFLSRRAALWSRRLSRPGRLSQCPDEWEHCRRSWSSPASAYGSWHADAGSATRRGQIQRGRKTWWQAICGPEKAQSACFTKA